MRKISKTRQEYKWENDIRKAICPICKETIDYPAGVYFRNGVEIHNKCLAIARLRRGKIVGIDY